MKKICMSIILIVLLLLSATNVLAVEKINTMDTNTASKIMETRTETESKIEEYNEAYDSEAYGMAAFILNQIRIYSIPLCFVGIAVGALYQYILGTRRLDMKQKGFGLIIAFITILVICQVLPLIFAIVVKGWRG